MNRRIFTKNIALALPAWSFSSPVLSHYAANIMKSTIKARNLQAGDLIGLPAPGSAPTDDKIQRAFKNLEGMGFRVKLGKNARAKKGYLAGEDQQRVDDLHQLFSDKEVAAVWCLRGGYGSMRLLPKIDFRIIRQNPKVFIGYSDITVLLQAIFHHTGLIGFHGPVATSTFSDFTKTALHNSLIEPQYPQVFSMTANGDTGLEKKVLVPGVATAKLTGGNLTLLAALCGSEQEVKFKNRIVFLEDIGEPPYRIDRMLTQLLQSSDLARAAGIVLGIFKDCEAKEGDASLTLEETLRDRLGHLGIPVVYGMPFGHVDDMLTFGMGTEASIDTTTMQFTLLESGVVPR